jgi:hypothetical protein
VSLPSVQGRDSRSANVREKASGLRLVWMEELTPEATEPIYLVEVPLHTLSRASIFICGDSHYRQCRLGVPAERTGPGKMQATILYC